MASTMAAGSYLCTASAALTAEPQSENEQNRLFPSSGKIGELKLFVV